MSATPPSQGDGAYASPKFVGHLNGQSYENLSCLQPSGSEDWPLHGRFSSKVVCLLPIVAIDLPLTLSTSWCLPNILLVFLVFVGLGNRALYYLIASSFHLSALRVCSKRTFFSVFLLVDEGLYWLSVVSIRSFFFPSTRYEGRSKSFATWHDNVKMSMHGMYQ